MTVFLTEIKVYCKIKNFRFHRYELSNHKLASKPSPLSSKTTLSLIQSPAEGIKICQKSIDKLGLSSKIETSDRLQSDFDGEFTIKMQWNQPIENAKKFISVSRAAGGQGQGHGKIVTKVRNNFASQKEAFLLEVIPWWLIPELSKLKTDDCKITSKNYIPASMK